MPANVIDVVDVDHIVAVSEMAELLGCLVHEARARLVVMEPWLELMLSLRGRKPVLQK